MVEKIWPIAEKLILNTLNLTRQLYQELIQEAALLKNSPQAELLDAVTANKKQLVSELEQFTLQLGQILATEKLPNNQDGVKEYFQRAENSGLPTTETRSNWAQIQIVCSECKGLNEQNGASIELLAQHAKRSLDILKGKPRTPNTYGRDGITQSDPVSHTLTFYL
ncbi:MAG: flagellar protein FlgN [Methyloglobulus sp.]|nr:flagellar protein FlgN [Methyloglobulus sp.]